MLANLEPAAQAFVEATADPPYLFDLGAEKGRAALEEIQSGPIVKEPVDITEIDIPTEEGDSVSLRILRPQGSPITLPVIIFIHGAGWVFGSSHTHDRLVRELAVGAQAAVVFPNYSRSPEAKYPRAIEESFAAAQWVALHGIEHGLDPERMTVAGDNVGGNMAIALALLAKQRGGIFFRLQVLFYPVTDASFDTPSYEEFATGYSLRRDAMQWFWDQYTSDPEERSQITASPLRANRDQLAGLPPALVITGHADVLRDEGEAFADKLRTAGVPVMAVRFHGVIHDFVMLDALSETAAARGAIALAVATLRDAFGDTA